MVKKVVMADVARLAGVSSQTVSRVFSGVATVSSHTRQKVEKAAMELNYQPNLLASALASGGLPTIGVLIAGILEHGLVSSFVSLEEKLRHNNYYSVLVSVPNYTEDEILKALQYLSRRRVEGILYVVQNDSIVPLLTKSSDLPAVLTGAGEVVGTNLSTVSIDNTTTIYRVLEHLTSQGVRSLVHITGDLNYNDARERKHAFETYCQQHHIDDSHAVDSFGFDYKCGYECALSLVKRIQDYQDENQTRVPMGICASNDKLAVGAIRALTDKGFRIGYDYLIAGFDDDGANEYLLPRLTSVRQDFPRLADEMLAHLLELMEGKAPSSFFLDGELSIRESSLARVG